MAQIKKTYAALHLVAAEVQSGPVPVAETDVDKRLHNRCLLWMILGIAAILGGLILAILIQESAPPNEPLSPPVWVAVGVAASGLVMMAVGAVYHVRSKGRHWTWVFLVFMEIPGIIILSRMPDQETLDRERGIERDAELLEIDDDKQGG